MVRARVYAQQHVQMVAKTNVKVVRIAAKMDAQQPVEVDAVKVVRALVLDPANQIVLQYVSRIVSRHALQIVEAYVGVGAQWIAKGIADVIVLVHAEGVADLDVLEAVRAELYFPPLTPSINSSWHK